MRQDGPWGFNEIMVIAAVRYCLGRQTYIVGCCADWLIRHWLEFNEDTRRLVQREIEEEFQRDNSSRTNGAGKYTHPLGSDMDRAQWSQVRALWI